MNLELVESHSLKDLIIYIKDQYEVPIEDIMDFEIYWDINKSYNTGYIVFRDTLNFFENAPILINDNLIFFGNDSQEKDYTQTFIIQKIEKVLNDKGISTVIIDFIDQDSHEFMKVYEPKGYKDKTIQDVLQEYIKKYEKDGKTWNDESKEAKWGNDDDKTLIVPGDRSWFKTMNRYISETDMLLFNKRKCKFLTSLDKLNASTPKPDAFKPFSKNQDYLYRVGDMKLLNADGFSSNITNPDIEVYSFDYKAGKKLIKTEYGWTSAVGEAGSHGGTDIGIVVPKDYRKIVFNNHNSKKDAWIQKKYSNISINMTITVPGTFENEVGDVIELELQTSNETDDIDENLAGKYLVTKITDKILAGAFYQQLTISRAKNK